MNSTVNPNTAQQLETARALCRAGKFAEGIDLFKQVIAAEPSNAGAHNFLGMALDRTGNPGDALRCFDRAIAADPNFADALANKGDALSALGRYREAVKVYDQALGIDPDNVFAWLNRGVALLATRDYDKALTSIDRTLKVDPNIALAHANRARALAGMDLGREALAAIDNALKLEADNASFHADRGHLLARLGQPDDALKAYDRALELADSSSAIHAQRGFILLQIERTQDGLQAAEKALSLDGKNPDAFRLRALAQLALGKASEALDGLNTAIKSLPSSTAIISARSAVHTALGNLDAAKADAEHAAGIDPDNHDLAYALGRIQLLHGDWGKAWPNYERRLFTGAAPAVPKATKLWDGKPLTREQLLLLPEGNAGDMIFAARFAKFLKDSAPHITLVTAPELVKLLGPVEGAKSVVAAPYRLETDPIFIRYFPLMSAPAVGGFGTERVPADVPYLSADAARVERFAKLIGTNGLKIGVAWQDPPRLGGVHFPGNPAPVLSDFAPLAAIPGVRLISLQKGFGGEEIAASPFRDKIEQPLQQIDMEHDFMSDAAAVIQNVDLVVAPENYAAHLAGALGKPVFTALTVSPSWYWLLGREDSIWYPTMRLFRQTKHREWKDVFERIAKAAAAIQPEKPKAKLPGLGG